MLHSMHRLVPIRFIQKNLKRCLVIHGWFMILSLFRGSLYKILHRPNCLIDEKRRIKMALDVVRMNIIYFIDMFVLLFLLIKNHFFLLRPKV
jgi:uncharacterized protein with PQ loop repeat